MNKFQLKIVCHVDCVYQREVVEKERDREKRAIRIWNHYYSTVKWKQFSCHINQYHYESLLKFLTSIYQIIAIYLFLHTQFKYIGYFKHARDRCEYIFLFLFHLFLSFTLFPFILILSMGCDCYGDHWILLKIIFHGCKVSIVDVCSVHWMCYNKKKK